MDKSAKTNDVVKGMELCSVLNTVIRDDVVEGIISVVGKIFRNVNDRRVHLTPYTNKLTRPILVTVRPGVVAVSGKDTGRFSSASKATSTGFPDF